MTKVFIVMRQDLNTAHPIAVFEDEGEALKSAESHQTPNGRTWVEELNYYQKGD